jgi:hypothetical protein
MKLKKKSVSIRDKFKRRDQSTLQESYDKREERTKGGGGNKSIFNLELLEELGIDEFKPDTKKEGAYYAEVLACSYETSDPYFYECSVHFGVGLDNDVIVCPYRVLGKSCYRCKKQKQLYGKAKESTDEIIKLYPSDRVIYLLWNRTNELHNEKDPEYKLSVWNSPKKGFHSELQSLVRDKKTKKIRDISDISEDGEGKTVYFEITIQESKKGKFPSYGSFELMDRDEPIPDEILEQLDYVINELEKRKDKKGHPLQALLYIPTYEEIEELMKDEIFDADESTEEDEEEPRKKKDRKEKKKEKIKKLDVDEEEVDIEELEEKLKEMNKVQILKWMKENDMEEYMDGKLSKDDLISTILDLQMGEEDF